MKSPHISRRRFVGGSVLALGTATLPACGGGSDLEEAEIASAEERAYATRAKLSPNGPIKVPASPAPAPAPAPVPGTVITTVSVSSSQATTAAFAATVLPLRGQVPTGMTLVSPDDGGLRASVLSRWDDGSAAVMVVAGSTTLSGTADQVLRLQLAPTSTTEPALTPARIAALVNSVKVDLGALGIIQLTSFTSPERIWWSNPQTICARYRVAAPQHPTLEAVIDIQAFARNQALVEVVVENARLNPALPAKPADASYSAVVTINGTSVAVVRSNGAPEATHTSFRAWYASMAIGVGPGVRAMQAVADLQKHPLLFKMDQASNVDMAMYASDSYSPWTTGRQRAAYMGNGGDHASIGPLTQWDARLLQTGDPRAALASEVNALACLGWNINHRSAGTGRVPTLAEVVGKSINGPQNWPHQRNAANAMQWEVMHHPATGLMAFVARPSPVFIELAQKVALWNALWANNNNATGGYNTTGLFASGDYSNRGRAWGLRSLAHATFLTPDGDAWKSAGQASISTNVDYLSAYISDPKSKLNVMWEGDPGAPQNAPYATAPAGASFALAGWMYQYLLVELHKIASARLLAGSAQTKLETLANWTAQFPVRWVNEQANGGWRYIPYATTIGRNPASIDMLGDWGSMRAYHLAGQPPAVSGPWYTTDQSGDHSYDLSSYNVNNTAGSFYPSYFWSALVAAVERGVPGANTAWATVNGNVTTLANWRRGFMTDPRWGSAPRTATSTATATPTATGSLGALESAATALGPGEWLDWSAATNVRTISDTNPTSGLKTAWLESKPNFFLTNWPGNITWDSENKRIILVGASQGTSADNPAGWSSAAVFLDVSTGVFSKQWNPVGRNLWHVYDSNSTRPLGGFIYRTAPNGGGFWKMNLATNVWSAADNLAGINLTYAAVPALEVHPTMGSQGSILISGSQGRLGVLDRATGVARQLAASLPDVNGLSPSMSYHPGIDAVVFGGSENSKSLYKVDNRGAITLLSNTLPLGVAAIGPTDATVLAPDPQGRPVAWLYDQGRTRRIWRLDLSTGSWSDAGAMPAGFSNGGAACVATIPELGVHVFLDGYGRLDANTSNSRVWLFRPR